jgi:transposase
VRRQRKDEYEPNFINDTDFREEDDEAAQKLLQWHMRMPGHHKRKAEMNAALRGLATQTLDRRYYDANIRQLDEILVDAQQMLDDWTYYRNDQLAEMSRRGNNARDVADFRKQIDENIDSVRSIRQRALNVRARLIDGRAD